MSLVGPSYQDVTFDSPSLNYRRIDVLEGWAVTSRTPCAPVGMHTTRPV